MNNSQITLDEEKKDILSVLQESYEKHKADEEGLKKELNEVSMIRDKMILANQKVLSDYGIKQTWKNIENTGKKIEDLEEDYDFFSNAKKEIMKESRVFADQGVRSLSDTLNNIQEIDDKLENLELRIHNNIKIFNELIKKLGFENTFGGAGSAKASGLIINTVNNIVGNNIAPIEGNPFGDSNHYKNNEDKKFSVVKEKRLLSGEIEEESDIYDVGIVE